MRELAEWGRAVTGLLRDAARVWWRTLPRLLVPLTLGYAGFRMTVFGVPFFSHRHPWLALFVLAVGMVCLLAGMIVALRVLGEALGIRRLLPTGAAADDRDESITRLLAITLLPFLGIYAVFDKVNQVAIEVFDYEMVVHGLQESLIAHLNPTTVHQGLVVGGVMVGTYVVRRGIDILHEKTGLRPLGLLAALCEAFFMLVLLTTGSRLVARGVQWLQGRAVAGWLDDAFQGLHASLGRIWAVLPDALDGLVSFVTGTAWPLLTGQFLEPLLWLAVAALVYGSHVLSLAEMWRKGSPLSVQLDERRSMDLRRRRRQGASASTRRRTLWLETQEVFFGDIDDKYLPTVQSVRLVLRLGLVFLGAYVLAYSLVTAVGDGTVWLLTELLGAHTMGFWLQWTPMVEAVGFVVGEPLRLALLAAAFARVLGAQVEPVPAAVPQADDQTAGGVA